MKKISIPALFALALSAISCASVFAAAEGESFKLTREEVIVYGSDDQIWMPERKAQATGSEKLAPYEMQYMMDKVPGAYKFVIIQDNVTPGAIQKSLKPGTYKCNAATFGSDPASGQKKFCKGMDDLAKNSGRPSIAGNSPRKYGSNMVIWRGHILNKPN